MTEYSLNETAARCKLAAKGAGYTWGMAEEVARAIFWLVAREMPGPAVLLELLTNFDTPESVKLSMPTSKDGQLMSNTAWLCPIALGCALSDLQQEFKDNARFSFPNMKCPLLLLPFVAEIARQNENVLVIELDSDMIITNGHRTHLSSCDLTMLKESTSVVCRKASNTEIQVFIPEQEKSVQRVDIDERIWEALGAYAHRTYAPSTESSRALGAGAGLNDND